MGMLDRIKKRQIEGFKEFVINMETTLPSKRNQIFTAGVLEDPIFMSYVIKNIRTFEDFLLLDSDQVDFVLTSQEQTMTLFAKCIFGSDESRISSLQEITPRLFSKLKDEISYLKDVPLKEREGAKLYIMKIVRKFQHDEKILGFPWNLPPQDIYYPKQYEDGAVKILFESDIVAAEGHYLKSQRIGSWRHNNDLGNILAQGDYSMGLKVGDWSFYYGDGKLRSQGKFKMDLKHGSWREWTRDGVLTESEYDEGVKKTI